MGRDPAKKRDRQVGYESHLRYPGRWAISFGVMVMFAEVLWSGTTWGVGAMWGAITFVTMWIYGRSKWGRRGIMRRMGKLDDSS